ncbi:MAG: Rpn family recombination-promoting nuclease/putative transposase [Solobacterium sp.]|nr:Rpn family recombination-promoting nuclease/putative transposase [Solobacterium sp.]
MNNSKIESLTLKNDFLFCTVFTSNEKLLKELVKIITNRKVKKVFNLQKQKFQDFDFTSKAIRLDVSFEDEEGVIYHIEMEQFDKTNIPKRMRYYQSNSDALQISKGKNYDELHKTYIIFICGYDPFGKGLSKYTFQNYCEESSGLVLGDETVKIILNTEGIRDNISEELRNLLDYFCGKNNQDTAFIQELDKIVNQVKNNKAWRERYMTWEEKYSLYLEDGRRQGIKEGIKEGKEETILAFITSRRNDGYSDEEIEKEVRHIFSVEMKELNLKSTS